MLVPWRPLAATLLPVVATMLLVESLLDLTMGDGRLVLIDGVAEPLGADALAWAKLATTVLLWLTGLIAGAYSLVRGTGPVESLWRGLKHLPAFAIGLVALAGCTFLALNVVGGRVLVFAVLAVVALVSARVLLSGIAWAVGGSDRSATWKAAFWFLLSGVAVPAFAAYAWERSVLGGVPFLGVLAGGVVLAAQVMLLARPHVTEEIPAPRIWPGAAMITAALLVAAGVTVAHPYDAPLIHTRDGGPSTAVALAWPAGKHPVVATTSGVWFCDDDLCEDVTQVNGGPPTVDGFGSATISADGTTVIKTAVTGGPDKGGPFVNYARCVREGCQEAWLPIRRSAKEKLDKEGAVEAAGASAPDGSIWLFVAAPVNGRYQLTMIRCANVECKTPERHQIGTAELIPEDGYRNGTRARLSIGADGKPDASLWVGRSVLHYSCVPRTCAGPQESVTDAAPPDAVWNAGFAFKAGELYDGTSTAPIALDALPHSGALAVAKPYVYLTAAVPSEPVAGFHLTIGEPRNYWRQKVWRCNGFDCVSWPMDVYEGFAGPELLAVSDDGRILVVRQDRILLMAAP